MSDKKNVRMTIKKWFGLLLKFLLAAVVAAFLGSESLNFFNYVFPPEQWYMAYTGFGLTMGAMLVYFYLFLNDAVTSLQKTISLIMIGTGILGELLTAGFGMQINSTIEMTKGDMDFMILAVRLLMFVHAVALIAYTAGDKIIQAFKDDDGDGIPNFADRHDNRQDRPQQNQQPRQNMPAMSSEVKREELKEQNGPNSQRPPTQS